MTFEEWWESVEDRLPAARDRVAARVAGINVSRAFVERAKEKARQGWEEHGGDIRGMSATDLLEELDAELVDALVYAAALGRLSGVLNDGPRSPHLKRY